MAEPLDILIVGGGIGGLTAAIILAKLGHQIELFEQAEKFENIGAGLQLSANAMQVMDRIGLRKEIELRGFKPEFAALKHYKTGKPYLKVSLGKSHINKYGQPYIHIHRADLIDILVDAAKDNGVRLNLNCAIDSLRLKDNGVEITISDKLIEGDLAIGADGVHSTLRNVLIGDGKVKYTGYMAWRGLVPADRFNIDLIGPGVSNWLAPYRHFVAYYVRGQQLINFVGVQIQPDWTEDGWSHKGDLSKLRTAFSDFDKPVRDILDACEDCHIWGLIDREPLETWTQGSVALLGDAAHPMLPFMAQGAAMAIEDGWALGHALTQPGLNVEQALSAYQFSRHFRTARMQSLSRENGQFYHASELGNIFARGLSLRLANVFPSLQDLKFRQIYGYDVTSEMPIEELSI